MTYRLIAARLILYLLIFLWFYSAAAKLIDFDNFRLQMGKQLLPSFLDKSLPYVLPAVEVLIAIAIASPFSRFQSSGLILSAILLSSFTAYVGLMLTGKFGKIPCSCGGILSHMSWQTHLIFNCFFLSLNISILILKDKKGGSTVKSN